MAELKHNSRTHLLKTNIISPWNYVLRESRSNGVQFQLYRAPLDLAYLERMSLSFAPCPLLYTVHTVTALKRKSITTKSQAGSMKTCALPLIIFITDGLHYIWTSLRIFSFFSCLFFPLELYTITPRGLLPCFANLFFHFCFFIFDPMANNQASSQEKQSRSHKVPPVFRDLGTAINAATFQGRYPTPI